jgi:hypothetical protein
MAFLRRVLVCCAFFSISISGSGQQEFVAQRGLLNARAFDFELSELQLNGEWEFYSRQLLAPSQLLFSGGKQFIQFPSYWEESQGYATYHLQLILNPKFKDYSLQMPTVYTSYALWVNGELLARNGEVAVARKEARAQYLPQLVRLPKLADTVSIVLQIANFAHAKGGIKDPIAVGLTQPLVKKKEVERTVNIVAVGLMVFIALLFLNIYLFVKKEKSILFFALMCLVWAMRSLFSEGYVAIFWMPWFDWELAAKIEYLTIYLVAIFALKFIAALYPLDTSDFIKQALLIPNYLFLAITISTYAIVFTRFLNLYLVIDGLVILYVVFVILRAIAFERYGAWFSVLGIFAGVAAFAYNILSYEGVFEFNPAFYYAGWLLIILFMSVALIYQLSPTAKKFNESDTITWDDMMKK